jgi:hypothetical protein
MEQFASSLAAAAEHVLSESSSLPRATLSPRLTIFTLPARGFPELPYGFGLTMVSFTVPLWNSTPFMIGALTPRTVSALNQAIIEVSFPGHSKRLFSTYYIFFAV